MNKVDLLTVMETWRTALLDMQQKTEQGFKNGRSGKQLARKRSKATDVLILDVWQYCSLSENYDLVALGGYGRREMFPESDLDFIILCPQSPDENMQESISLFMQILWDLRLKLGASVCTLDDAFNNLCEHTNSATAFMESRLIYGKGKLINRLQQRWLDAGDEARTAFALSKLQEFDERRQRTGLTAFLMEPDVKEGQGGLRDIQSIFWLAQIWHGLLTRRDVVRSGVIRNDEWQTLKKARNFLWRVRIGIHLLRKRGNNRLDFETQSELADTLGYEDAQQRPAVEWFMKDYFTHAGRVARITDMLVMDFRAQMQPLPAVAAKPLGDGMILRQYWLDVTHPFIFRTRPLRLLRIFHIAQKRHRRLSSHALRLIQSNAYRLNEKTRNLPEIRALFLNILRHPRNVAWTLKEMHDTGVLAQIIPAFKHATGLGQFNRYHAYPVDVHTINAISEARSFRLGRAGSERMPLAVRIMERIEKPELLYLALLFHDLAKGMSGDHSIEGEKLAASFCHDLQLSAEDTELITWLVRQHLTMAKVSQRSDLNDENIIADFVKEIGSIERLQYLLLLTVADICAVGPDVWNDWKGNLLGILFERSACLLRGLPMDARGRQQAQSALANVDPMQRSQLESAFKLLPTSCITSCASHELLRVGRMIHHSKGFENCVQSFPSRRQSSTEVLVLASRQPHMFAGITSAIASTKNNIVASYVYELKKPPRILYIFHVQDRDRGALNSKTSDEKRMCKRIRSALKGKQFQLPKYRVNVLMRRQAIAAQHLPRASHRYTAIKLTAADRTGLLTALAHAINTIGVHVRGAAVSTFGEKVVDVFFLSNEEGKPLTTEHIEQVCSTLEGVAKL
ncbi:MAG: [protein-PII] uridylyltransferase [Mariprofundales bacterium]